jgi:hypothetical protein
MTYRNVLRQSCALFCRKLRIWGCSKKKFADWQFSDWHTSEIYGFAIAEYAQEFEELRFADIKKCLLAHLCKSLIQDEAYLLRFTEGTANGQIEISTNSNQCKNHEN